MHLFSTDAFLEALADAYFPNRPHRITLHRTQGRVFRLLSPVGRSPITRWPFLDFHHPVDPLPKERVLELPYLPCAVRDVAVVGDTPPTSAPLTHPAPFIDWSAFPDWRAFEQHFSRRRSSLVRDSRRKRRGLLSELGAVEFRWDDPRTEVFSTCLRWKSAQYLRASLPDLFARRGSVALFELLKERGHLRISSLAAGGKLLAVHLGATAGERFYSWIAAYDPDQGRYSPGRLLLEDMLRESLAQHREWDFGVGGMDYKWHYATHYRIIGALGQPPVSDRLVAAAKSGLKFALQGSPRLMAWARQARRLLTDARDGRARAGRG